MSVVSSPSITRLSTIQSTVALPAVGDDPLEIDLSDYPMAGHFEAIFGADFYWIYTEAHDVDAAKTALGTAATRREFPKNHYQFDVAGNNGSIWFRSQGGASTISYGIHEITQ